MTCKLRMHVGQKMRRRSARREPHRYRPGNARAVAGIRRCLLCLRNDASDTDSDSVPLSSLLDDDDDSDTDAVGYSTSLLTQMNSDAGNINPAVCAGLMQVRQCLESDRSHDEARYRLPDNYATLKPITDADNRCLIFVNQDAQRPLVLSPL